MIKTSRTRLDRFLSTQKNINKRDARLILAQHRVTVDGIMAYDTAQVIDHFSKVSLDGTLIQNNTAHYIMLNKPLGVVSATKDPEHQTVIDLLDYAFKNELHIVGRLDLNSTGLILLTNDSHWSKKLMHPENKSIKQYRVTLENPVSEDYIQAFENGMHFPYEDIITQAVTLKIISPHVVELSLTEGRYHQIKRMFGRFRNPVKKLHRFAIGNLGLDELLKIGENRKLTTTELKTIH